MASMKCFLDTLRCGILVSFLIVTGCTSANYASYAGTYNAANDPGHTTLQLNPNGTAIGSSDWSPSVMDIYTVQNKNITICAKDTVQCASGHINDDGSIVIGNSRFQKN